MKNTGKNDNNSYLTFSLDNETFGIHVSKVVNILEMTEITKVPKAPAYIKGVINLRGTVLPVIDIRIKFGMAPTEQTLNTCILVLEPELEEGDAMVGGLVDSVKAVMDIDQEKILSPPSLDKENHTKIISGMVKSNDKFIMILDIDRIFNNSDIIAINNLKRATELKKNEKETMK